MTNSMTQTADHFLRGLEQIEYGVLELLTPDGRRHVFEGKKSVSSPLHHRVKMEVQDWRVIKNLALRGDRGFAEDYQAGHWDTDSLPALLSLGLLNDQVMRRFIYGSQIFRTLSRLSYLLRLNTLQGSKKNIHAHYDLGNDFYSLWLDHSMTYSSALYKNPQDNLLTAQHNKYDRIIEGLGTKTGSILEIGCGWGGFAERALLQGDYHLKGVTLSTEQHAFAQSRLKGLPANIVIQDYRHQTAKYDSIVSIEMFEAVGERYWKTYFEKIKACLKTKGKAVIQTITMDDQRFESYRRGGDVIRSYIFPGGMLPSPSRFREEAQRAGLKLENEFHFGQDYARTLQEWLNRFDEQRHAVKAMGYDEKFIRLWRFYLAACIAGFSTNRTSVMQVELSHA